MRPRSTRSIFLRTTVQSAGHPWIREDDHPAAAQQHLRPFLPSFLPSFLHAFLPFPPVSVPAYFSLCLSVSLSICLYLSLCLSVSLSVCLSLAVSLCVYLSLCLCLSLSLCLY